MMRPYHPDDFAQINVWNRERDVPELSKDSIPKFGFIVPNVACGFLTRTDTKVAFFDCFVTNPGATREDRGQAIEDIWHACLDKARELGYNKVMVFTKEPSIAERCINAGADYFGTPGLFTKGI
jgi:hypothetical protein